MKNRFFAWLLVFSIMLSLWVMPVSAVTVEDNTTPLTDACPCGCGKTLQQVTWQPWTGEANTGHYYLGADFTQPEELTVISGNSVVLDLRGNTLTTTARERLFTVNGYLGILDSVGGGRMTSKTASTYSGGIIRIQDNETAGSLFELYSGTIMPRDDAGQSAGGGLVGLGDGATFRMYDGMLLNGNAKGSGGAIYAEASTTVVEILGGRIAGCKSTGGGGAIYSAGGTTVLKNCELIGNTGSSGGNVTQSAGSLTVENCTIANGISTTDNKYGGGNLSVTGNGKITITDSRIYGGYTFSNGGNLSLGYSTTVIKNTQIYGGTCEGQGSNISLPISSANVTLDNCTVDGGMDNIMGTLTLKGATKISLTNGGLDLSEQTKTTKASGLTEGAEIYVSGSGKTITGGAKYLKPALRSTLTVSGSNATVNLAADGVTAGYCPHCNTQVAWQPYGTAGATHTYLTEDMPAFAEVTVASTLVINTEGFDITAPGRAFSVTEAGDLAIIDAVGGSIITGSGVHEAFGGIIQNAGSVKLYGGKYVFAAAKDVTPAGGSILSNDKHLSFYHVILDASAYKNTSGKGGAIYQAAATTQGDKTITGVGGRILGGNVNSGGGIFVDHKGQTELTAVHFYGGKAASVGGNVYTYGSGTTITARLDMTGCTISGGSATQHSGNVFASRHNVTLKNCYVTGGKVTDEDGGNLYSGVRGNLVAEDCIITNGTARKGGNVMIAQSNAKGTLTNCLILNGTGKDVGSVAGNGGNVSVYRGILTIDGGLLAHGTATTGGNLHVATTTAPGLTVTGTLVMQNGTATTNGGNACITGIVDLQGASFASGEAEAGQDLYVSGTAAKLKLGEGVTGDIRINATASLLTDAVYGGAISGVTCKAQNAAFLLDGQYGDCGILVDNETMYVATTAVVDEADNATWYASNAAAVAACGENSYVKLFTGNDLELTKDLYVDINGQTVNVTGDYTFYGMDSTGDSYSIPAGYATLTGNKAAVATYAPNGKVYIAGETAEGFRFHRLDMKITGVSIRPSVDGIYYTAKWYCDDALKAKIDTYGVVASTQDMPDASFAADAGNLWTTFHQESFVSGASKNGAVIAGILKADGRTAAENNENGKRDIYAKAYVTFTDGTSYISTDNVGFSLYEVMKSLDKLILAKPVQYRKHNQTAREFYEKWKDNGMGGWKLSKIPKPADDGVINVLMVGSSFCYYYVEELYALGQAAGIDIRVCNLYYSGCPLEKHYTWWANGQSNYQYYETYHDGRRLTSNVSLEWGLAQQEWDFISLQESSSRSFENYPQHAENTRKYWQPLLNYFLEQLPDTKLLWHQPWTYQAAAYGKEGTAYTPELQQSNQDKIEYFCKAICDNYNTDGNTLVQRVPSGIAWQNMRNQYGYDFLTCRLGKTNADGTANAGDGYHDGDIGGGQYLNAAVWFEIVTGKSVIGNTYIPEYTTSATLGDELLSRVQVEKTDKGYALSQELVAQLQQAAHEAVAALGYEVE